EFYYIYDSYGRYASDVVADNITSYRVQALQSVSEYGLAETNCFILRTGYFFSTTAHPSKKLNDTWLVISAHHQDRLPQSVEEDNQGEGAYLTNRIQFSSSRKQWRPPYQYKPQADGPEVATVVGPKGEEIFTNELGQVRVHFHWNKHDKAEENASCWVRVARGWDGNGYGFYAIS